MAYKMTHPESDHEISVAADHVAMFESQGWETAPTAKAPAKPDSEKS